MSLGLHLAVLERERVMPAISRPKTEISSIANDNGLNNLGKQKDISTNEVYRMKEFSLIDHIESLKASAYGELATAAKNTLDFPHISRRCHLDNSSSPSSRWALDPASVEGNLRLNSSLKQMSCTLEDIASRGSSCPKGSDNDEDDEVEKVSNRSRKKSAKGAKRKFVRRKEGRNNCNIEKDLSKQTLTPTVFSDFRKKRDSSIDLPSCEIPALTALCKSIKIHQKSSNSISVKDTPYPKKSSQIVTNALRKSLSPARASLSNAIIEYGKKHQSSSDQRRKQNNLVEESVKTKIFLSEKQSGIISDCGTSFPCAPPATPTTDQLKRIEYVPSLQDIRSQRSIRQRLQILESKAMKKEKKKQETDEKVEKMTMREKRLEKKRKQRQEIYALNKLMTDWEHERFRQFMSQAGSNI